MNKLNLGKFFRTMQFALKKHSPEILTGIGVAGLVVTPILAVKATPKALKNIEDKKEELGVDKLSPVDTVKATWKPYLPAVSSAIFSAGCMIGANTVHMRRTAALTAAYTISETTLKEYKDKVVETIGEKKEQSIRNSINQDRIDEISSQPMDIIETGKGQTLFYDYWSGRLFRSDRQALKKIENVLNRRLIYDIGGRVSLNDLYDEIGLEHIKAGGDDLVWCADRGFIEFEFDSTLYKGEIPCAVVDFVNPPTYML